MPKSKKKKRNTESSTISLHVPLNMEDNQSQESVAQNPLSGDEMCWYETTPEPLSDTGLFPILAVETPEKPAKKRNRESQSGARNWETANAELMEVIRAMTSKQDETLRRVSAIGITTEATSKRVEELTTTVKQLSLDVQQHKQTLEKMKVANTKLQEENKHLREAVAECQRYSRRWSLKMHGVRESRDEDIRGKIIDILGKMAPKLREDLKQGIDIVHRVGKLRDDGAARSTIVLFALRRLRDAVWKEAKNSQYLQENRLRITEALSPEDRAAREKLWPLIKKARDEGKKASFRGASAVINGKVIDCPE